MPCLGSSMLVDIVQTKDWYVCVYLSLLSGASVTIMTLYTRKSIGYRQITKTEPHDLKIIPLNLVHICLTPAKLRDMSEK